MEETLQNHPKNRKSQFLQNQPAVIVKKFEDKVSHEQKPSYFPLYWLVNRDPYDGLL